MGKIDILGVMVDRVTMDEAVEKAWHFANEKSNHVIFTPNSEIVMSAYQNPSFCHVLNSADMVIADGIGVVYASRILKAPLPERVAGFDLATRLIEKAADGSHSFYFFGGRPGVAEQAIQNLKSQFPKLNVVGFSDGYFDEEKEQHIIKDIQEKKPDILFVCLGAPKQEQWIAAHREDLAVPLALGIGGSLDVWAGTASRAPEAFQKAGLEWLYRLLKQPSRFFRMLALPKFGLTVLCRGKRVK